MSTINMTFDTVAKTMKVTVDGKEFPNIVQVEASKKFYYDDEEEPEEPEFRCSLTSVAEDETADTRTMVRLVASESPEGKEVIARAGLQVTPIEGFVVAAEKNRVRDDIASFFSK